MDYETVFSFLNACADRHEPCVLVIVCAVEGSSMREAGTVMAVAQDGTFAGSLSGGCIENAVVSEALEALAKNEPRRVRFGAGSPYLDIKLPCGGGVDVHFEPLTGRTELVPACFASLAARRPFSLVRAGGQVAHEEGWRAPKFDPDCGDWSFGFWPAPVLQIIGHGAGVEALAKLACAYGCWPKVYTPDERIIAAIKADGGWVYRLKRADVTDMLTGDAWTANVFLFHDHDWEIDLMARALELPHFYIGAMGGRRAHAFRTEALAARGVSEEAIATIHAPIGLFHSSRDPQTLALSTLAEVIRAYQDTDFEAALG